MKRLLLLALILLTACRKPDPAGTIQFKMDAKGHEFSPDMALIAGDNTPFRISGGDYLWRLTGPTGMTYAESQECQINVSLVRYGEETGAELYSGPLNFLSVGRKNSLEPGVYFLHLTNSANYCLPTAHLFN